MAESRAWTKMSAIRNSISGTRSHAIATQLTIIVYEQTQDVIVFVELVFYGVIRAYLITPKASFTF